MPYSDDPSYRARFQERNISGQTPSWFDEVKYRAGQQDRYYAHDCSYHLPVPTDEPGWLTWVVVVLLGLWLIEAVLSAVYHWFSDHIQTIQAIIIIGIFAAIVIVYVTRAVRRTGEHKDRSIS